MEEQEVNEYNFPVSRKAKTLAARPEVIIGGQKVTVDPQLLFQRLSVATSTQTYKAKQEAFGFELCSYAPSLFDPRLFMRNGNKSELADALWKLAARDNVQVANASVYTRKNGSSNGATEHSIKIRHVIDGGSLLHRIPWSKENMTCRQLLNIYVQYVLQVYGKDSIVVFDNYPSNPTTKDEAHMHRAGSSASLGIQLQEDLLVKVSKKQFIANKANTQQFITLLSQYLSSSGIQCLHAEADADRLMALSDIYSAKDTVTVVNSEDTDVLKLLLHLTPKLSKDIIFVPHLHKICKEKQRLWPIQEVQRSLGYEFCSFLLFIHSFSGCDTTSRPYGMGKASILAKVTSNSKLGECADIFTLPSSNKDQICEAGDLAMRLLTGGNSDESLAIQCYKDFRKRVLKGNTVMRAEVLPPTSGAIMQHSLRTYHQVMAWLGISLPPEEYGYYIPSNKYSAKITEHKAAPDQLLNSIFCNCKTLCDTKRCTCKQYNLSCTDICGTCKGMSCKNIAQDLDASG